MRYDRETRLQDLGLTQPDVDCVDNPLDFIADDHMREREVCAMIDAMVLGTLADAQASAGVTAFLTTQLPQHLADEEIDLFPLMLARCPPEDEIGKMIDRLLVDHRHARLDTPVVIRLMRKAPPYSKTSADKMTDFAKHARRHLILENAVILPIARARLTDDDLAIMKRHMRERRSRNDDAGTSP